MLEQKDVKKYLGTGFAIAGLLTLTGCASAAIKPGEKVIDVNQENPTQVMILKGENWTIRRMTKDIFIIREDTLGTSEKAVEYISSRCKIIGVGAWKLDGGSGSWIREHTVTVQDGTCIDELIK